MKRKSNGREEEEGGMGGERVRNGEGGAGGWGRRAGACVMTIL